MASRDPEKILIVDDTDANLQLLTHLLTEEGYSVYPALDGELALEFVRSTLPDLILLDIRMPGMDGHEVCRRLKADERTRAVPVIFISIVEDEHEKVKGFQEGAVDYITKPFRPEEVLARIRTHLRLRALTEGLEQVVDERMEELTITNRRLEEEIAERRRAEQELVRHREHLEEIVAERTAELERARCKAQQYLDIAGVILVAIDARQRITMINEKGCEVLGGPPGEIIGKDWFEAFVPEACRRDVVTAFQQLLAGEIAPAEYYENPIMTLGGKERLIAWHNALLRDDEGNITGTLSSGEDITERKKVETALRESEARQRALIDNLPFEFWAMDGTLRYSMQNAASIMNYGDMVGKRIEDLGLPPDVAARRAEQDRKALAGDILRGEYEKDEAGGRKAYENLVAPVVVDKSIVGIVGVAIDITARKRAEDEVRTLNAELEQRIRDRTVQLEAANRELRTSEERYRVVFENSPVSIWEEDFSAVKALLDGLKRRGVGDIEAYLRQHPEIVRRCAELTRIITVNRAALTLHGAAAKEDLLAGLINTFTVETFDTFRQELVCLWKGETALAADAVVKTFSGEKRRVSVYFAVCPGYETTLSRVLVSLVDITERKLAEEALLRERLLLSRITETSPVGITVVNRDGLVIFANLRAERLLGLRKDEIAGRSYNAPEWRITDFEGGPFPDEGLPFRQVMATKQPVFDVRHAIEWPGGQRFLLSINGAPLLDEAGEIESVVFAIEDITESSRAERSLRESEQKYRDIFDNVLDGLYLLEVTEDGRFRNLEVNPALERSTGIPRERMIGKTQEETVPADVAEIVNAKFRRCVEAGRPIEEEVQLDLPAGRRQYHSTLIPARDATGRVTRIIGISRDITERKRSEESLMLLNFALNNVRDEAYLITEEARFEYVNDHACRALGYTRGELLGSRGIADVDPDFPMEHWKDHWRELRERRSLTFEGRHRARDGRIYPVEISANYFEYGGRGYNLALVRDITERKRIESALRASEQNLALHVNQTPLGVIEWDLDFKVAKWNPAAERIFGYSRSEALGCHASMIVPHGAKEHVDGIWQALVTQKGGLRSTNENVTKDGRSIYCEWYNTPLVDVGGNVVAVASLVQDVTERKKAEEALRASEESLRKREALLNESQRLGHIGSWAWDAVKDVIWWSDEYYRMYGLDPATPTPNYAEHLKVYTAESAERLDRAVKRTMETGESYELDLELAAPIASTRWICARGEAKRDAEGNIRGLRGTAQNITERKTAEDAIRESEAFIRNILESVDEGFIIVDRDYRIVSANRAFGRFAGQPESDIVGKHCHSVSHDTDRPCFESGESCPVKCTFDSGSVHSATHVHQTVDGSRQDVEIKSYPIMDSAGNVLSVIETVTDVTERHRLEDQLRQAQKMEAVGTLAGGIAHDFNNILTAIIGYANIVKLKMRSDDPDRASIDQILMSGERASRLTQGLLAFSRKQVIEPRPVDLNDIVRNVETLLRRIIGEDVTLTTRFCPVNLITMADTVQIEQVLMNLATNARDAMPDGGDLTITTEAVELGEDFVALHGFGSPGRHALIAVTDTGQGMNVQTREHIFDPFYTTKEPGKGTGLGLAVVYGVVKQHNGNINVYSEPGKGTTFKVYLPLIVTPEDRPAAEPVAEPEGGTETVLLAEDDEPVRNLISIILKQFGYRIIEVRDGREALKTFDDRAGEIDLLVLDVIMPHKSGKDVYEAIKVLRPDIPVLFISGYTADILDRKGISGDEVEFISKPVHPFELLRKVREVLDRGNDRAGRSA